MHPLHPYLAAQLSRARQQQVAADWQRTPHRSKAARALRERVGWLLIGIGLRFLLARRQPEPAC